MLRQYTPMIPTLIREPFHREGSVYEEKVDAGESSRTRMAPASIC